MSPHNAVDMNSRSPVWQDGNRLRFESKHLCTRRVKKMATEITSLKDLYIDHLKDIYSAENMITKALPKVIKKVASPELKHGLESHLKETEKQVQRIERIFESLDNSPRGKKCVGMEGVLEEGKEVLSEKMPADLKDAALIGGCQKVEHYEISAYGTVIAFANLLGEREAADLLNQSLEEEKAADQKLTDVAMSIVNRDALMEPERM
jgi:ferritin-like metal-binding protein YciE